MRIFYREWFLFEKGKVPNFYYEFESCYKFTSFFIVQPGTSTGKGFEASLLGEIEKLNGEICCFISV